MITMVAVARPQVLSGDYNAREAYDAVPQLHARGEGCIQNINKRARETKAKSAAAKEKPTKKKPAKAKANKRILPKGKRLRSDQVDALAVEKEAKRRKKSDAHKAATNELASLMEKGGGRTPNGAQHEIAERMSEAHGLSPD
jgi:hypothetical protein